MSPAGLQSSRQSKVHVIIPTKNEEVGIAACILAAQQLTNHVTVVDSNSDDATAQRAKNAGADVVNFRWNGEYPKKKQWCLDHVAGADEWALFIDADELIDPGFAIAVADAVESPSPAAAYAATFSYHWRGRRLKYGQKIWKTILVQPSSCRFPEMPDLKAPGMGEQEGHYQPSIDGRVGRLEAPLTHNDPDPLRTWIDRHNRYSDWEAYLRVDEEARRVVRKSRTTQGKALDMMPFKGSAVFLNSFVRQLGFLDGRHGFEYAASLAAYQYAIKMKVREGRSA